MPYLLDLRPILLRIGWAYADQGLVDVTELGRRLCVRCPRGHHLRLTGGSYSRDEGNHRRRVRPGEVLTAEFLPDYIRAAEDLSESDAQVSLSEDGAVLDSYGRYVPNASGSSAASSHDGGTGGSRWHTRNRAHGTSSQYDAYSHLRRDDSEGGESRAVCRRLPRVWFDKWICCVLTSRLPDGNSWFTSVLAGLVLTSLFLGVALRTIYTLAPYIIGGACICRGIRHNRGALLCIAGVLLLPVVCAGSAPHQGGDTAERVAVPRPGLGVSAAGVRPVATPCRQRLSIRTESGFSIGPTLLQQSFGQADCRAFFEARALLETLFEHFSGLRSSATSRAPSSAPSECSEAPDASAEPVLSTNAADVEQRVDQNPVCLRLLDHLPCPTQDLSHVGLNLPFGLDDVQRILRATWTLPTTLPEGLKLRSASAAALTACLSLDAPPSGEIDHCEIYTDGAFEQGRSAWAFVVIGYIQRSPLLIGWARGPVVLPEASPWVGADEHSALNGERTALFWALAWSLQFGSNLPCQVFVDSLVALRQTNGVYGSAADSVIAHACRALAQAADSLGGVRSVCFQHVRAHKGHPYNELADTLAGAYAVAATEIPIELARLTDWVRAECLDWLWLYISATRSPHCWPDLLHHSFVDQTRLSATSAPREPSAYFYRQAISGSENVAPSQLQFCMRIVAVNVQRLDDGAQAEIPGRSLYVRSQLDACGATITGLQETRAKDTGTLVSDTHLRYFAARDAKGNGGVELWFSRTSPFAWDGDEPVFFHPNDFRALAWNERYLIVRFDRHSVRITFAVIHALSPTHPDREKWWAAFSAKLHACAQDDEVVLLGGTPDLMNPLLVVSVIWYGRRLMVFQAQCMTYYPGTISGFLPHFRPFIVETLTPGSPQEAMPLQESTTLRHLKGGLPTLAALGCYMRSTLARQGLITMLSLPTFSLFALLRAPGLAPPRALMFISSLATRHSLFCIKFANLLPLFPGMLTYTITMRRLLPTCVKNCVHSFLFGVRGVGVLTFRPLPGNYVNSGFGFVSVFTLLLAAYKGSKEAAFSGPGNSSFPSEERSCTFLLTSFVMLLTPGATFLSCGAFELFSGGLSSRIAPVTCVMLPMQLWHCRPRMLSQGSDPCLVRLKGNRDSRSPFLLSD